MISTRLFSFQRSSKNDFPEWIHPRNFQPFLFYTVDNHTLVSKKFRTDDDTKRWESRIRRGSFLSLVPFTTVSCEFEKRELRLSTQYSTRFLKRCFLTDPCLRLRLCFFGTLTIEGTEDKSEPKTNLIYLCVCVCVCIYIDLDGNIFFLTGFFWKKNEKTLVFSVFFLSFSLSFALFSVHNLWILLSSLNFTKVSCEGNLKITLVIHIYIWYNNYILWLIFFYILGII